MAIDQVTKKEYNEKISDQKKLISELDKEISAYKKAGSHNKKLKPYFHIGISAHYMKQIHIYIDMNDLSEKMLDMKNNSFLDNARKLTYKIFSEMESVATMRIDEKLDFNRDKLLAVDQFNPKQKLNLYKHLESVIKRLIASYGQNTKWLWSFPELWAKLAILGKNLVNYREIQSIRNPSEEFYYDRDELLNNVKQGLFAASDKYRDRYELSTKSNHDLLYSIKLLQELKRICSLMGDDATLKKSQAGIDAYKTRIKAEEDDKDKGKNRKQVKKK